MAIYMMKNVTVRRKLKHFTMISSFEQLDTNFEAFKGIFEKGPINWVSYKLDFLESKQNGEK